MQQYPHTLLGALGIELLEVSKSRVSARMPVDERTVQPAGLLHGGASAALAETVASIGSHCLVDSENRTAVGIELSISHLNGATKGFVVAHATPYRIGKSVHVWKISIEHEDGRLIAESRCTLFIKPARSEVEKN